MSAGCPCLIGRPSVDIGDLEDLFAVDCVCMAASVMGFVTYIKSLGCLKRLRRLGESLEKEENGRHPGLDRKFL